MHLSRLWENPKVTVLADEVVAEGRRRAELRVTGIVCNTVCVTRPTVALKGLSGVTGVSYDEAREAFVVEYEGSGPRTGEFERAILGTVVARGVRGLLERIGGRWRAG